VLEAEAVAVHLEDVDVVGEAFGAEDFGPFVEGRLLVTSVEPRS
jgi:hypothetical protein